MSQITTSESTEFTSGSGEMSLKRTSRRMMISPFFWPIKAVPQLCSIPVNMRTKWISFSCDKHTYQKLDKDPTPVYKCEFIGMIRKWQNEDSIPSAIKNKIYPTTEEVPKIYCTPKIYKADVPLRLIVSSIESSRVKD